jgi:hypothetical protein
VINGYLRCEKCDEIEADCKCSKRKPLPVRSESTGWVSCHKCDYSFDNGPRLGCLIERDGFIEIEKIKKALAGKCADFREEKPNDLASG